VTADLHKLSAGRADYYTREIAKNREEYLSGHGESPGEHLGGSAAALGLEGTCSAEAFKHLFAWRHPETGEQLGRPPRTDAMPAWDLVFRPTKSVSVLYGLGDEQTGAAVLAAHKHAVRQAVAYLDSQVGTRRGHNGAEHVGGSGLLATGFVHRTSRAGDPLLHTHLIIHNRTRGEDGQWRTLDSRDLLNHRAAADAVYRAAYQQELSRTLGVRWTAADRWGNRELVGMPDQVLKQFSKRHEQITAELARLEREEGKPRTGRLVQLAVHATRQPKQHETPETLYGRWQDEARTLGVESERLVRDVTGPVQVRTRDQVGTGLDAGLDKSGRDAGQDTAGLDERTIRQVFDQLAGPEGLTEQASTFAHRDVLAALGGQLPAGLAGQVSPDELAHLADRFVAERAVSVMPEHATGEHRYATPELLAIEQRLIEAGVGRADEQTAVCSHDTLRAALGTHSTIGDDQAAMVRDITQGGAGVAVVVGKPGTGKTYALGVARHAWQLEGYRVVGTAPTGIAAVCLGAEGFEDTSTVDRLLMELDQERATRRARDGRSGRHPGSGPARQRDGRGERQEELSRDGDGPLLDGRTVLVVDEAAMLGSRKLDRLLDYAQQAHAKVVLVGDDRQLASIEAGGGFRGLRLRLGASTLTVNRRQRDTWQRKAAADARNGDVDAAIRAYREHGRMVSTETPTQAKQAMLADWWPLFQQSLADPGKQVAILTRLRGMADEFNGACQQLRDQAGQLGPDRLRVGDRTVAVGDLVVCGKNALAPLGVANGSRGQVVAVDPEQRQLTVRLEGSDGREVTLPRGYLDERPRWWTRGNPDRRTIDLGYATTGHKAQGLTREHALVYVSGAEDRNWYEVQDTRARGTTRFYGVTHPEPRTPELDVPHAERGDVGEQLAQGLRRDGSKQLAVDVGAAAPLDLRGMPTHQLRAERDRLAQLIDQAPPDQARLVAHTTDRHQDAEHRSAAATGRAEDARALVASLHQGTGRLLPARRRELAAARDRHALAEEALTVARQQADRAADRARVARHAQAEHQAWLEDHADILAAQREVIREDGWRRHARSRAAELLPGPDRPAYLRELGEPPASVRGRRAWRRTLAQVEDYRQRHHVTDPDRAIGEEPHGPGVGFEQRQAWRSIRQAIDRAAERTRQDRNQERRERAGRERPDVERDQASGQSRPSRDDGHRSMRDRLARERADRDDHERAIG